MSITLIPELYDYTVTRVVPQASGGTLTFCDTKRWLDAATIAQDIYDAGDAWRCILATDGVLQETWMNVTTGELMTFAPATMDNGVIRTRVLEKIGKVERNIAELPCKGCTMPGCDTLRILDNCTVQLAELREILDTLTS